MNKQERTKRKIMRQPHFYGIRHLSPAGAYYLREYLADKHPKLVLIEGPSDFNDVMTDMVREETKPPIAILAYTSETPVRTILYPFAEYSPEYQAICWCHENNVKCSFFDLPANVFLAFSSQGLAKDTGEEGRMNVYERLDEMSGDKDHETFWERTMEHAADFRGYHEGTNLFGANIRSLTEGKEADYAETVVREAYMRNRIAGAVAEGIEPEDIVVVTGAYHVEGLKNWEEAEKLEGLPTAEAKHTLMPYSYYRLSTRSGYGAGNRAPAYYELLWDALRRQEPLFTTYSYLARIAASLRKNGNPASPAQVIEAVRLAETLAVLRGGSVPTLRDLRDAAITCIGGGSFASISLAAAEIEIGKTIGSLPEGTSRTSIQEDFYRQLKELKLEKYRDLAAQDIMLDLRENRRAATEKTAFLDLYRSFFLHRLRVINVSFAANRTVNQENATWSEHWIARWTPEAEIELVEAALKGDTVAQAASFAMKERVENAATMGGIALVIEDAFYCGMSSAVGYAAAALQGMAVDAASVEDLAQTAYRLSVVVQYGDIRKVDSAALTPILKQIFYRACLTFCSACVCDDEAAKVIAEAMEKLNGVELAHEFIEGQPWLDVLTEAAGRDDLNSRISGYAMAILLERGKVDSERLRLEVKRRLSKGVPAELGAGWFAGLAMKNQYALIARLSLWESLDEYLEELDDEEFKRALVFLRRAFADFSAREKDEIAENLGEIWGLNGNEVSEIVNSTLSGEAKETIDSLKDFDFDF